MSTWMGMWNKRKAPRQERRLVVRLHDGTRGLTRDVSPGGMCVLIPSPPSRGARIKGAVVLEGEAHQFAGVVAWRERPRAGDPAHVGIRFTGVSSLLIARLQRTFTPTHLPRFLGPNLKE